MENLAEKHEQIASFVEIVGESREKARQFLVATNWKLDEAIQLFYANFDTQLPSSVSSSNSTHDPPGIESYYVRPSLPVKREALYDDDFIRDRDERLAQRSSQSCPEWRFWGGRNDKFEALYHPPFKIMFKGSFEQEKFEGAAQGKWSIANVQSTKDFGSHMLNRDTWANQTVKEIISTRFIFWQIYDNNEERRKVCKYYHLTEMPSTLVIDSITRQKMKLWEGMISPQRLLEELIPYIDNNPMEFGHPTKSLATSNFNAYFSLDIKEDTEVVKREYPTLPEEPQGDKEVNICRVAVCLLDCKRVKRRFLEIDPIQLLWSFCCSQLQEASDGSKFRLAPAVPGASVGTLDYDSNLIFGDSGLSNSLIFMTWE